MSQMSRSNAEITEQVCQSAEHLSDQVNAIYAAAEQLPSQVESIEAASEQLAAATRR